MDSDLSFSVVDHLRWDMKRSSTGQSPKVCFSGTERSFPSRRRAPTTGRVVFPSESYYFHPKGQLLAPV